MPGAHFNRKKQWLLDSWQVQQCWQKKITTGLLAPSARRANKHRLNTRLEIPKQHKKYIIQLLGALKFGLTAPCQDRYHQNENFVQKCENTGCHHHEHTLWQSKKRFSGKAFTQRIYTGFWLYFLTYSNSKAAFSADNFYIILTFLTFLFKLLASSTDTSSGYRLFWLFTRNILTFLFDIGLITGLGQSRRIFSWLYYKTNIDLNVLPGAL